MYKHILRLGLALLTAMPLTAQTKYEIRATWLTTLGGMDWPSKKATSAKGIELQKEELRKILDQLQAAHFNTVLFQTRMRGDVSYPSAIEAFSESFSGHEGVSPGYDPLQFAVEECHKRGMEIHAWMVTIPSGNNRQVKLLGNKSVAKRHPSICKPYMSSWYLDPGNPQTDDYLASLVREVVSKYDIDGVHFDYIRYPERAKGFPDAATYRKYGRKQPIEQWRRDNITRIVRRLYTETKKLKPWVKVSSSPVGKYKDTSRYPSRGWNAYEVVYQDPQRWLKDGIQDAIFPMMYFQGNNFYPFALDWQENKGGRWVVPGLGIYFLHPKEKNWKVDEILRQIRFTRDIKADGQAYFRNKFLLDDVKGLYSELSETTYATPAVVPPMTWIDSIAPSRPCDVQFTPLEHGVSIRWKASTDNLSQGGVFYRIYASDTYPVDVNQGLNLINARVADTQYTYTPVYPWEERTYWAITAVDRCGNESEAVQLTEPLFQ